MVAGLLSLRRELLNQINSLEPGLKKDLEGKEGKVRTDWIHIYI